MLPRSPADALVDRSSARAHGVRASAPQLRVPRLVDELDRYDNRYIKLRADATVIEVREALRAARDAHGEDL